MKEAVVAILLIASGILTPLGAKRKSWMLFSIGAGCGMVVFTLLFVR